jgi:3',5'-cyclic AMP phosphodiesterase CpdA
MSLRLVHLSDIHFGMEDKGAIEAALAMTLDLAPSLTLVTGDLTLAGRTTEFMAARAWLDRLPGPLIATPGNHDTPYYNLFVRSFSPFHRWRRYIGADDFAVYDGPGLSVAAINSARGAQLRANWAHGAIDLTAIGEVATRLAAARGSLRVFACHHPLVDVEGGTSGGVRHGRAATRTLCEAGVDLILSGHVHTPFARPLPYCDGCSYVAGAGTLSRRTRGVPATFSVIEAGMDTITVTAHAWRGAHFEPFSSWDFPRRGGGTSPAAQSAVN